MEEAFKTRWVHGLNTQAPWSFVDEMVSKEYSRFAPVPWFIGEYGANGQDKATIQGDLAAMQKRASESDDFLGAAFFQFQTTYWKGGAEMNFGLFSLGTEQLGETGEVCDKLSPCRKWPVHCLSTDLSWLPGSKAERAEAAAAAWGGRVPRDSRGFCGNGNRRLSGVDSSAAEGTILSCQIRRAAVQVQSKSSVKAILIGEAFSKRLSQRFRTELGADMATVRGMLIVRNSSVGDATSTRLAREEFVPRAKLPDVPRLAPILLGAVVGILVFGGAGAVALVALARKGRKAGGPKTEGEPGLAVVSTV